MPATMAGSRGGVQALSGKEGWRTFAERVLANDVRFDELATRLSGISKPASMTLVVNNTCNLKCRHCYLQVQSLDGPALTEEEWGEVLRSTAAFGPDLVCFSGKELFRGHQGPRLLSRARELRNEFGGGRVGLITNGTLVGRHREAILEADPSYFDISLDGMEADHDAVRGAGAFAAAWPNVLWAAEVFGTRFFINLTLQRRNLPRALETIRFFAAHGIRNIEVGFYKALPYTDQTLALSDDEVRGFLDRLGDLRALRSIEETRVLFDFDVSVPAPLEAFLASRWFDPAAVCEDVNGELFVDHRLNEKVVLQVRFAPYPTGVWRSVRITPEGGYLAAEDTIDTAKYSQRWLGNVRDTAFDVAKLHERALRSQRFHDLLRDYERSVLPRLVSAVRTHSEIFSGSAEVHAA